MTSGVGVKPASIPFEGKAFPDDTAAAVPRNACADAATQGEPPTRPTQPPLSA